MAASDPHATHTVFNQPPPLEGYNVAASDRRSDGGAAARGGGVGGGAGGGVRGSRGTAGDDRLGVPGEREPAGAPHATTARAGGSTRWNSTRLARADGARGRARAARLPWREPRPGAHVARAALFMSLAQVEAGVGCPLSMTYSAVPALRLQPELAAVWEPRLTSLVL